MRHSLWALACLILSVGCSQRLIVKSDPADADVYVTSVGGKDRTSLGKTPLEMTGAEFKAKSKHDISDDSMLVLLLEKKDYMTEKIVIPGTRFNTVTSELNVHMRSGSDESTVATRMVEHLRNSQNFINANDLGNAMTEVDKALEYDDHFSMALCLKGTIFYLQKNYVEALRLFETALKYDERTTDATRMIAKIKEEQRRTPSGK